MSLPSARFHLFVYGTLRPGGYYHRRLVAGHEVKETAAWVRGQLYALAPGYPGMTAGDRRVEGDILSFDDEGLLQTLDQLEGFDPLNPSSLAGEYTRELCPAFAPDGASLGQVWAYWMLPSRLREYEGRPVERWDHLEKI